MNTTDFSLVDQYVDQIGNAMLVAGKNDAGFVRNKMLVAIKIWGPLSLEEFCELQDRTFLLCEGIM